MTQPITVNDFAKRYVKGIQFLVDKYAGDDRKRKLKEIRDKYNLTREEFSEVYNIAPTTVRNWESGQRGEPNGAAATYIDLLTEFPEEIAELNHKIRQKRIKELIDA